MRLRQILTLWILVLGVLLVNPFVALGAPCPAIPKTNLTQLGRTSDQLLQAKGPPTDSFRKKGPSSWLLYDMKFEVGLKYGKPSRRSGNFIVSDNTYYYLDTKKRVIGFNHFTSNRPYRMAMVKDALPWAGAAAWNRIHFNRRDLADQLLATLECDDKVIMLLVDCYKLDAVNPKTFAKITRKPKNISECRYRALLVQLKAMSPKNPSVQYRAYTFGR